MLEKIKRIKVPKSKSVPKFKSERYVVGLDIGTEYVKALVAKVENNQAEIIGVGRAHQKLGDMQAGAIADIAAVVAKPPPECPQIPTLSTSIGYVAASCLIAAI